MPQLNLNFHDISIPEAHLWEEFEHEQQRAVIEILSRLLTRAMQESQPEPHDD